MKKMSLNRAGEAASESLLLVLLAILVVSCRKDFSAAPETSATQVRGELIAPATNPAPAPLTAVVMNDAWRKRHPKPPSTQRRMVMSELTLPDQTNLAPNALPSGTKGTAADLAKTNLPSISSFTGLNAEVPGYADVNFDTLAGFDFVLTKGMAAGSMPEADIKAKTENQIPASVRSLNGKKTVVEGFLLPVRMQDGLAVEFLLMRNQSMCCYGVAPKINEWITVVKQGKGVKPIMDQPVAVAGVLSVGPMVENGCLAGIYRLDADKVIAPF